MSSVVVVEVALVREVTDFKVGGGLGRRRGASASGPERGDRCRTMSGRILPLLVAWDELSMHFDSELVVFDAFQRSYWS